ncbi:MAG TPA: DUF2339 domain-containing protein [Gaiellaceae bacterium]|nr:DUF2339 domain-containing protein [Gaiellaceae bacterium]
MNPARSLEQRLDEMEALVRSLVVRVTELELERPPQRPETPPQTRPTPPPPVMVAPAARAPEPTQPRPPIEPPDAAPKRPELSFEDLLGGRILAWLGALAIVIGAVFFLVIAVDRGWIGVEARIALAFTGSTILLAGGLFLYERRGQTEAAVAAVAAALAALYASLTYATAVKDVIATEAGLVVAALVGATGAAIAIRWRSQFVAGLALVGALAAPVLVGGETSDSSLAFMVVALVATVSVLLWQRWGWLALGAFLVSAPQLVFWAWDRDDLALPLTVVALNWSLFVVAAIGYELRVPTSALRVSSASVLLLNAALTTALGWLLIDDRGLPEGATAWVFAVTVAHVLLGGVGFRRRMSTEIAALLVAVGVGLSGVTLALALDGPALVAGWSAEAVLLAWVASRTGEKRALVFSIAFLGLAALHTLVVEAPPDSLIDGVADLGVAVAAVLCVALAALLVSRWVELADVELVLLGVGAVALLYAVSLTIVDLLQGDASEPSQTAQVALSTFWGIVGLVAIVVGLASNIRELRYGGLALLGLGVAKVFAYDLAELDSLYRVLSFLAVGILLLVGAYAYQRVRTAGSEA